MDPFALLGLVWASGAAAGAAAVVLGSWSRDAVRGRRARRSIPASRKVAL